MVNQSYAYAFAEVLEILKHTKKEDVDKISPKFMKYLYDNASKTYRPDLDHTKKVKDMELRKKTKVVLAIIYKKFWCDENQRVEFDKKMRENEVKIYLTENMLHHNNEKLFQNNISTNMIQTENTIQGSISTDMVQAEDTIQNNIVLEQKELDKQQKHLVEYNESFFKKLVKKFSKLFGSIKF